METRIIKPKTEQIRAKLDALRGDFPNIERDYTAGLTQVQRAPLAADRIEPADLSQYSARYTSFWIEGYRRSLTLTYVVYRDDFGLVIEPRGLYDANDFDPADPEVRRLVDLG